MNRPGLEGARLRAPSGGFADRPASLEPGADPSRWDETALDAGDSGDGGGGDRRRGPGRRWNGWTLALLAGLLLGPLAFGIAWLSGGLGGRPAIGAAVPGLRGGPGDPGDPGAPGGAPVRAAAAPNASPPATAAASPPATRAAAAGVSTVAASALPASSAAALTTPAAPHTATRTVTHTAAPGAGAAVLTVATVQPQPVQWQPRLSAAGAIGAWQEVTVSLDAPVGRVMAVLVQPGDVVRRGQRLAQLDTALAQAEGQRLQAALAEARAAQLEADAQWRRVQLVLGSGVISTQQESAAQAAAAAAAARVQAQQAALDAHQLRLRQAQVLAPVDGVVLRLGMTVGQAPMPGQELLRLQREGRLEWRAELPAAVLSQLRPGQLARVQLPDGQTVSGRLRQVEPVVDAVTRQGVATVTLEASAARAGMVVRGEIALGSELAAWTLPASALRPLGAGQGVFVLQPDGRVRLRPVTLAPPLPADLADSGRRVAVTGLDGAEPVVADGAAFLNDGDRVRAASQR